MAELVDALVSGTSGGNIVGVRVPFWAVWQVFTATKAPAQADSATDEYGLRGVIRVQTNEAEPATHSVSRLREPQFIQLLDDFTPTASQVIAIMSLTPEIPTAFPEPYRKIRHIRIMWVAVEPVPQV
jgi:hypothetical protein